MGFMRYERLASEELTAAYSVSHKDFWHSV